MSTQVITIDDDSWSSCDEELNLHIDVKQVLDKIISEVDDNEVQYLGGKINGKEFVSDEDLKKVKFGIKRQKPFRNYTKHCDIRLYMTKRRRQ